MKKTIVFDFDGVIHQGYKGWRDGSIYGEINYELLRYIETLMKDYYVVISSNRPAKQIVDFMNERIDFINNYTSFENINISFEVFNKTTDNMYWEKDNVIGVTNEKAIGILYIDDRGFRYNSEISTKDNMKLIKEILDNSLGE